jgi:pyruvate-formate lyase-activating enzyme
MPQRCANAIPPRLLIDLATRCNLRCPFCSVWGDEEVARGVKGTMDPALLRALLAEVAGQKAMVQPSLWGEPLVAPQWRESFAAMHSAGLQIALNTNGLTLDTSACEFLCSLPVASIFVSLDALASATYAKTRGLDALPRVCDGVANLIRVRANRIVPRVGVSFVRQPPNEDEERDFVETWIPLVDVVRVSALFVDGTFVNARDVPSVRTPCPVLWETLPVHHTGQATICCLDAERATNMGSVTEDGVSGVWGGARFEAARAAHLAGTYERTPFCLPCNGWAQAERHTREERLVIGGRDVLLRKNPIHEYYNRVDALENWMGALVRAHD